MKRSGLIAKKIGNSSYFSNDGNSIHVTILKVEDCVVSKIKTLDKDGYNAVQLASIDTNKEITKIKKPQRKNFSLTKIKPKKITKEFRVDNDNLLEVGTSLNVDHFIKDQFIDVTGISIGKAQMEDSRIKVKLFTDPTQIFLVNVVLEQVTDAEAM